MDEVIPLQDLKAEYAPIKAEVMKALEAVLDGMQLYLGPNVSALEEEFASYIGVRHAIGTSSGTDALWLAYHSLGVKPGDEVLVPSHTFIATVAPLAMLGARPVFIDIDPESFNMDPALLEAALTERTRGIVAVHLYGQPVDMDPVVEIARKHGLWVVEDAAQAVGSEFKGRKVGTLADIACFSFVYTKNVKAYGDAGMVTTSSDAVADQIRRVRDHGRADKYTHPVFGVNARLGELEAAILRVQMKYVDERTEGRRKNAASFSEQLGGLSGLVVPKESSFGKHVYHLYVVRSPRRDALATYLRDQGIHTGIHYPVPCHLQEASASFGFGRGSLPNTERAADEILSLPVYPEMTRTQVDRVVRAVREFCTS
jgi:dTDP-4-amino-4,6-dideoxygalactose transaminase